ncbi:MAG: tetratricopeptide repeat protein, partial [Pedobacter sp.]
MLLRYQLSLLSILLFPVFVTAQFTKNKDSVLSILRENKKVDSTKVIDYARVSQAYNQKPDSAIYYIKEGLKLARTVNFKRGIALMNSKLGAFYLDDGRYKQADSVFRIALSIHRKLNRYEDQGTVYQALSAVYSEAGDEVNSLKYILIARQLYEKRGLKEQLPFCNGTIGIVYLNQGEVNNAVKYIKEGIRIAEDLKLNHKFSTEVNAYYNLTILADLCTNLAAIFSDRNDYRSAVKYYDQSIKVSKEGGFYDSNVLLFVNAADVYRKTGDEKRARTLLDTALRLAQQGNLYREKYKIYTQLAMLESSPAKALPYFDKAIQLASKQLTDLMEIYDDKAEYFKENGQYKEALEA